MNYGQIRNRGDIWEYKNIKIRCKFKGEIGNIYDLLRTNELNLQNVDSPLEKM